MAKKDNSNYGGIDYAPYYLKNYKDKSPTYQNAYYQIYKEEAEKDEVLYLGSPVITEKPKVKTSEIDPIQPVYAVQDVYEKKESVHAKAAKPKRMNKKRVTALVICLIMLCFSLTLLLTDYLSGGSVLASFQNAIIDKNSKASTYYALEVYSFSDYASAKVYATQLRQAGAAGYVIDDESYHVIADVYVKEEDAKNVLAKSFSDYPTAKIYPIGIKAVKYSLFPKDRRDLVKQTLGYIDFIYGDLSEVARELSTNQIDENTANQKIRLLLKKLNGLSADFETAIAGSNHELLFKIKIELIAMEASLENLLNATLSRPNFLCDIRYTCVMAINSYRALCAVLC